MRDHYRLVVHRPAIRKPQDFSFRAKVWVYDGPAAWYFVTLPKKTSAEINHAFGSSARGWGSLRVRACIGESRWETSIFPDKKAGAYLLPLKAAIRKKENLRADQTVQVQLTLGL